MGPFCCPSLLLHAAPIYFIHPHIFVIFSWKTWPISAAHDFYSMQPYLFSTPTTSLFATYSWKIWAHSAVQDFFTLCNPNMFPKPTNSLFASFFFLHPHVFLPAPHNFEYPKLTLTFLCHGSSSSLNINHWWRVFVVVRGKVEEYAMLPKCCL